MGLVGPMAMSNNIGKKRPVEKKPLGFVSTLEPMIGFEPTTYGLRYRCSTN